MPNFSKNGYLNIFRHRQFKYLITFATRVAALRNQLFHPVNRTGRREGLVDGQLSAGKLAGAGNYQRESLQEAHCLPGSGWRLQEG
jgi:hypothetical protein